MLNPEELYVKADRDSPHATVLTDYREDIYNRLLAWLGQVSQLPHQPIGFNQRAEPLEDFLGLGHVLAGQLLSSLLLVALPYYDMTILDSSSP
jgi:hypothetical protein